MQKIDEDQPIKWSDVDPADATSLLKVSLYPSKLFNKTNLSRMSPSYELHWSVLNGSVRFNC